MRNFIACLARRQVIFFVFVLQIGHAQQGFIRAYNLGYPTSVRFTSLLESESELILGGFLIDSIPPVRQGVLFARIDTSGQVIDFKTHFDSLGFNYVPGDFPAGMTKLDDGSGFLLTGNQSGSSVGFLIKFDLEGNLTWEKRYEDNTALVSLHRKIIETETGFLITGAKQKQDYNIDIFLLKTDKEGNKLWEKNYGLASRNDDVNSLLYVNNNEYILGGYIGPNQSVPWEEWHHQIQIFAVDSLGNEKWRWESDPPVDMWSEEDMGCVGLQRDVDGNWVYATRRWEFVPNTGGAYLRQGVIVKRDEDFNLLEEKTFDEIDENGFLNLLPLSDGDWLFTGSNYELVENPVNSQGHINAWLGRLDANLDSLWTRNDLLYSDTNYYLQHFLHSAVELPSGNIIAAGYFTGGGHPDHGILIKVNQHGCIDTFGCVPTNITFTSTPVQNPDLKIYPNPARHILHYESDQVPIWDKVELLDMTGRVVKTETNNLSSGQAGKQITLDDLPSGLYILRLWKDGRFWVRRIVRQ